MNCYLLNLFALSYLDIPPIMNGFVVTSHYKDQPLYVLLVVCEHIKLILKYMAIKTEIAEALKYLKPVLIV